jgi:hypothetical protein
MHLQERNTLWEMCETPGLLALLPGILNRTADDEDMQQLILNFRAALHKPSAAAGAEEGEIYDTTTTSSSSSDSGSSLEAEAAAGAAAAAAAARAASSRKHSQDVRVASSSQPLQAGAPEGVVGASDVETVQKAQAHVAWLLAALASDPRTR